VNDHRVRAGADRAREAAVALEGGLGALGADELLGGLVERRGRDTGAGLRLEQPQAAREDLAGGGDAVDLLG